MRNRLTLTPADLAAISRTKSVTGQTRKTAAKVRTAARREAPKRTGAGARSIGIQRWYEHGTVSFRVSWDRRHFYMIFSEDGTSKMAAKNFLRRAGEAQNK